MWKPLHYLPGDLNKNRTIDIDVSKRIKTLNCTIKTMKVSQWETILDYAVEVQEFLLETQRKDHSPPAESNITFKQDSWSRIPQNPRMCSNEIITITKNTCLR
jgi:hypothetical protein